MSEYIVGRSTFGHDLPIGETYSNYGDSFRFGCEAYGEAKAFGERITRCRDCQFGYVPIPMNGKTYCTRFVFRETNANGFCSCGEPKVDE